MAQDIRQEAERLRQRFGAGALSPARAYLESAVAARDHRGGLYWADVCSLLAPSGDGVASGKSGRPG